ncbi:hypothetical protein [Bacillus sp. E(2018)]
MAVLYPKGNISEKFNVFLIEIGLKT